MLLRTAWRNLWRNRRRSAIILASIAVGAVAVLLNDSLSIGMVGQILNNQIGFYVSDIQIHRNGFNSNKELQKVVPDPATVDSILHVTPEIAAFSRRVVTFGLLSSATNSGSVMVVGIEPGKEEHVTTVARSIVEGQYLSDAPHQIVIGRKLAERLGVQLGDKVVAMASTLNGDVGSDLFRVAGIFQTVSAEFDKSTVFIGLAGAQKMLGLGDKISEFAMLTKTAQDVEPVKERLRNALGSPYEVLSFADLLPLMVSQMELYNESLYVVYLIIGLAMIFGIINTMLMSVFERMREFGVLMAIGIKNRQLVMMIFMEAFLLGGVGTLIGLAAGVVITLPLSSSGIDLSMFSESLTSFGSGSVIYPTLRPEAIVQSLIILPMVAVLGAAYPAWKATRLQPVKAIRYV